jgi:FkbM family methyltransferase
MQPGRSIKALAASVARAGMRLLAANPLTRVPLNTWYGRLGPEQRAQFHHYYARIFRGGRTLSPGTWKIRFGGRTIRLPLRPDHAWLDWDTAVSILAHDYDVKLYYEALLASPQRPELFYDVGANYGTHSVLLASHGIRTLAFEPNPSCRDYCAAVCALNGLTVEWQPVAIGAQSGEVDLVYPGEETWLGSINPDITASLRSSRSGVSATRVPLKPLDAFPVADCKGLLIKIDVEGGEIEVLKGAASLLKQARPIVLFESNDPATRPALLALFASHNYGIFTLPPTGQPFDEAQFNAVTVTNFVALPQP